MAWNKPNITNNSKGFSLIELVVVCLIMVLVILITNSAFEKITSKSAGLSNASRSNIDGIVGLELMRADLESAGFGLPWSFESTVTYSECKDSGKVTGINPAADFNDAPSNPPRSVISKTGTDGIDYLAVKSAAVGDERASRKWSYVSYSSSGEGVLRSYNGTYDLNAGDYLVTIKTGFGADASNSGNARQLVKTKSSGNYYYKVASSAIADPPPGDASELYVAYGISTQNSPAMPFNRADYYIHRPGNISPSCATGPGPGALVGNLYRSSVSHADGKYNEMALANCVLDMQVYFMRDPNNDNNIRPEKSLAGLTAQQIREQVKGIHVNILAQEGGLDRNYTYPGNSISLSVNYNGSSLTKTWDDAMLKKAAGNNWKNYRWKVYTIAVQPKNLNK